MSTSGTELTRGERLIEALDRPLLGLAVLTVLIYLTSLWIGDAANTWPVTLVTLAIDVVFVLDLLLKLRVFGIEYVQTPWFLIDLISCLPLLDAIANGIKPLRALRFVRALRMLRILRSLRILRALRSIPAFERFVAETPTTHGDRKLHHYMNVGLILMTLSMLVTILAIRQKMEGAHLERIEEEVRDGMNRPLLKRLGGGFEPPRSGNYITRETVVDGAPRTVYFDLQQIENRSDEVEFFLILGMMFSMLFLMYIIAYHQLDMTQAQLRGLLNLALPKQVAERFVVDPGAYNRKSRMPATILFMDFVGFTQTCEALAHDPDELSAHLEAAMDRLVGELVRHDLIIDKFIGDAVMSFRGGPLVPDTPEAHAYRAVRSAVDSTRALADLNDPFFHRVKIGGASAGDCLIGAFGTSARLSYTILGDGVNLAARLEPASAQCGTRNLFCEATHALCAGRTDLVWRRWGRIRVHGKNGPIAVYEAFDVAELGDPTFLATYHRALDAFERRDFGRARDLFALADRQRRGGDEPSRVYVDWCARLLAYGPPVGWEPVLDTHK